MNVYLLLACLSTGLALYLGCIVTTKEGFFYASVALLVVAVVQALCIVSFRTPEPPPEPIPAPTPVVAFSLDFSALETLYDAYKIDNYLARYGSPAVGTGRLWIQAEAETGVSASLMLAIYRQESTLGTNGTFSRTHFNGWGIHNPQAGEGEIVYRWSSWTESVPAAFRIVANTWGAAQTAGDLPGYCGGDADRWREKVEMFRTEIEGILR